MMKRAVLLTTFLVMVLSGASAAGASPIRHELLSTHQLPHWSRYYLAAAQTASCPESTFRVTSSPSASREVFVQRSSATLLLERLGTPANPTKAYEELLDNMTKCPQRAAKLDGHVTFQRLHQVHLGTFAVPVAAYTITAVVSGANVSGVVAYARKGRVVVALAELSLDPLNARSFKALMTKALADIS